MNALDIRIADTPAQAPNYRGGDFKGATLREAVIVKNGTVAGRPTVDLIFEIKDADGNVVDLAVAMTTGAIIEGLAAAIKGAQP